MTVRAALSAFALATLLPTAFQAMAQSPLPTARPEAVGMSSERLARLDAKIDAEVAAGRLPGAVIAVARHGKLVHYKAYGWRDKDAGLPMTTDSIFSMASMTKPLVSVATLMLQEDGRLFVSDPVGRHIPELAKMSVATNRGMIPAGQQQLETVPAKMQPTVLHLLTHTSGLLYGGRGTTDLHKLYPPSSSASSAMDKADFIAKLASLPLASQPGTVWEYSLATDVLGILVERVAQQPLEVVLRDRILTPLKMKDTGFLVPAERAGMLAKPLPVDPLTGNPQRMPFDSAKPLKFNCGGGCGVTTAGDYIRFTQMLLNGGVLDGQRILSRKTVEYMTSDHLGPQVENTMRTVQFFNEDYGFGLGFAVRRNTGGSHTIGTQGEYYWSGAFGTFFMVDPKEQLAVVLMMLAPGSSLTRMYYRQVVVTNVLQALEK
jgi:CubicO group peptidase (beta-lactamase class C family)